ncbi:putative ankyrin repeat protein RF_0381 [Cotesia glomerata]|uniref:putative ankyrin repeat protein RF_0381 n=1 Tax=Cotesia glomerata TaxID=32391 RepID=UPI001D011598|nr:putative ankyrin repeat protein RF_0381 [Cotesia glomerata]
MTLYAINSSYSHITLLHKAVGDNNYKEAKNLINLGENVNSICHYPPKKYKNNTNCTALHLAVSKGNKKIVELLLKNNADINIEANCLDSDEDPKYSVVQEYFNRTPLLLAIAQENKEIVELLIKNNADVNLKTSNGESALGLALKSNNKELIEMLLTAGVDINLHSENVTSLHWAVANNNYAVAEYLINHGSDVNTVCHYPPREFFNTCCSPLHVAVKNQNIKMVELLLRNNADVNVKANCDETTPCYVPMRDYFNRTPLHIAVDKEDKTIVKILIKHKADVNLTTKTGETALGIAVKKKNLGLIKILIHADAHVNSINPGHVSPLYLAISREENFRVLEFLLDHGADFNNIVDFGGNLIALNKYDRSVKDVIKRHIIKLEALSLFSGPYLGIIGTEFDIFTKNCNEEIEKLKKFGININKITFFDTLTMCQHKLAMKLTHVNEGNLALLKKKAKLTFPLYGELVKHHLTKAARRKKLLIKANITLTNIFKSALPNTFLREMYYYFSNQDLKLLS